MKNKSMDYTENENEIPYNPNNKYMISKDVVEKILNSYKVYYSVKNIELFQAAFTHKSYLNRNCWSQKQLEEKKKEIGEFVHELRDKCYEDLEFLGDSLLDFIVVIYIMKRYPDETEGFYTKLKSKLVSGVSLSKIAKKLNFHKYLIISKSIEDKNGRYSEKILEDVFEAFLGALYKDSSNDLLDNISTCNSFIFNMLNNINDDFDFASILLFDNNYKDQLLKFYHQNKWGSPRYIELKVEETSTMKIFNVGILNPEYSNFTTEELELMGDKKYLVVSVGSTKKKAEQQASKEALRYYGALLEDIYL